jgi:NAD(P)-dependent dehydrogenase (short-subunit alcohol dehydrogenase family)
LKNKVAIVTGAASGIGKAIAHRFASEGALVIVANKNTDAVPQAVEELNAAGGRAAGFTVDVTVREDIQKFVARVVEAHNRIDILVNNADITRYRPFLNMVREDWDVVLDVDLKGVFFCSQAVAPHMSRRGYGKIVNIPSALGTGTTPHNTAGSPAGSSAYAAAKAAVIQLTKTLARELGPHGVNVNCVAPGTFVTPITISTRTAAEVEEHMPTVRNRRAEPSGKPRRTSQRRAVPGLRRSQLHRGAHALRRWRAHRPDVRKPQC